LIYKKVYTQYNIESNVGVDYRQTPTPSDCRDYYVVLTIAVPESDVNNLSYYHYKQYTMPNSITYGENTYYYSSDVQSLYDVGLGYMKLGQSSVVLSGGEAQRVKLANELQSKISSSTLYILDEPTTGLHVHDIKRLMEVIGRIADQGATVLIIEHNLDVIKLADYFIDMGPEGGDKGGTVVFQGRPEDLIKCESSYNGKYLKPLLENE
jgi:excinuclease ABC subunit A